MGRQAADAMFSLEVTPDARAAIMEQFALMELREPGARIGSTEIHVSFAEAKGCEIKRLTIVATFLMVVGAVFLLAALWLVIPVAVNLPVSWPGGVLVILFAASGILLVRRSIRGSRTKQK
jgi:hypothetical protein